MGKTVPMEFDIFARDRSGPVFDKFGRRVRSAGNDVGFLTQQSKNLVAAAAGYVAFDQAAQFLRGSVDEARESVKVNAQTEAALIATGSAANINAKQIGDLAESISLKIGVDDEAIQSGANLLLTFKNVRNEVGAGNAVFNRATVLANDLAAAGFGNLESSSKMLGKALNDPLKGITALGRAGVTFSAQQKEQIANLVETGDLLSAQKMILQEVESQVGGSAEAQADSLDKLQVAWDNIKEEVGGALLPVLYDFSDYVTKDGVPAGERFAAWLREDGIPATKEFAAEAKSMGEDLKPLAESILPALAAVLDTTATAAVALAPAVKSIVDAFLSLPEPLQTAIILGGATMKLGGGLTGTLAAAGGGAATGAASRTAAGAAGAGAASGNPIGASIAATVVGGAVLHSQLKHNNEAMFKGFQPSNRIPGLNPNGGKSVDLLAGLDVDELRARVDEINAEFARMESPFYRVGPAGDSFEDLQAELAEIQGQIETINARPVGPEVQLNGVEVANDEAQTLYERLWNIPNQKNVMTDLPNYGDTEPKARTMFDLVNGIPTARNIALGLTGYETTKSKLQELHTLLQQTPGGATLSGLITTVGGPAVGPNPSPSQARKKKADAGPIIGPGGPRDDIIPIDASNGEHMWSAAEVTGAGGHAAVERMRRDAKAGRRPGGAPGSRGESGAGVSEALLARSMRRGLSGATFRIDGQRSLRATIGARG